MMAVSYEWDIETVDAYGDIVDHFHDDRLAWLLKEASDWLRVPGIALRFVLVRDTGDDREGLGDREWFYPTEGDTEFDGGTAVPKKYLAEWTRHADAARRLEALHTL